MKVPDPIKMPLAALLLLAAIFAAGCSEPSQQDVEDAVDLVTDFLQEDGGGDGTRSGPGGPEGQDATPPTGEEPQTEQDAGATLAGLDVAGEGSMAGYSRELFPHWSPEPTEFGWEEPAPGCDVRDAALIRDGAGVEVSGECEIYAGRWADPFTGAAYTDPQDLDIDHLVPLAEAYRSGAADWSVEDRETYANAPGVLITADDGENQEKSDQGPEDWRPPDESFWCEYAIRWTEIKGVWGLSVDTREKQALEEMLSTCN